MRELALVLAFRLHPPTLAGDRWMRGPVADRIGALLEALEAREEQPAVLLDAPGHVWTGLAHQHADLVRRLAALAGEDRIRAARATYGDMPLVGFPKRDLQASIRLAARQIERCLGRPPSADHVLAAGGWSCSIPMRIAESGVRRILVPWEVLEGVPGAPRLEGPAVAAHDRHHVWMIPSAGAAVTAWEEGGEAALHRALEGLAARGARGAALVFDLASASTRPDAILAAIERAGHLAACTGARELVARWPRPRRVHAADWAPPEVTRYLFGPEQAPAVPRPATWEGLLARYGELARLHDRVLRAWARCATARELARRQRRNGPVHRGWRTASRLLERAWPPELCAIGPEGGFYDPALRRRVHAVLHRVDAALEEALGGRDAIVQERSTREEAGRERLRLQTPHLALELDADQGGAITSLVDARTGVELFDVVTRRPEPDHPALDRALLLPSLVETADGSEGEEEDEPTDPALPPPGAAWPRVDWDRVPQAALVDRFLGPAATPEAALRGQVDDRGDFAGAPYALLSAEHLEKDLYRAVLSREGRVRLDGPGGPTDGLVQVLKRLDVPRDLPGLLVRYEVSNRLARPLGARFSTAVPVAFGAGCEIQAAGLELELGELRTLRPLDRFRVVDRGRAIALAFRLDPAATVWSLPVRTVLLREGRPLEHTQGASLWLTWPADLWGHEKLRLAISFSVEYLG